MTIHPHDDFELMSMRRLSDSLEATRTMQRQAQLIARDTQTALIGLATEFCGQALQQMQERNEDLYQIPAEELASLLRSRFKSLTLSAASDSLAQLAETNRAIEKLRSEIEAQRARADLAEQKVTQSERQIKVLESSLEKERLSIREVQNHTFTTHETPPPGDEMAEFQTWYTAWQANSRNWKRDCELIVIIGQTGACLFSELGELLAREKGINERTVYRVLTECVQAELLEQTQTASIEGRPPLRYTLSDKGKWLYRELTGVEPKSAEHLELLKAHKSERHLALILKSAEEFTRLGYRVDREPVRLQLEENRYFEPDLVVRKGEDTYYLEVETGEKDKPSLSQKWENAVAAGGRICVVTDNMATLRRIQGSIAQWSILDGRRVSLYITSLVTLKEKKPWESPWYAIKEYAPG
jgi:DNA-binding PadR family transcriptional regulator